MSRSSRELVNGTAFTSGRCANRTHDLLLVRRRGGNRQVPGEVRGRPLIADLVDRYTGELHTIRGITDNGPCYKAAAFARYIASRPEFEHVRTRHRCPETNGVIERFYGSIKYEHLYLHEIDDRPPLAEQVAGFQQIYNSSVRTTRSTGAASRALHRRPGICVSSPAIARPRSPRASARPNGCTRRWRTPTSSSTASRRICSACPVGRCSTRWSPARPTPRSSPSWPKAACAASCLALREVLEGRFNGLHALLIGAILAHLDSSTNRSTGSRTRSSGSLVPGDSFSRSLTRAAGETVAAGPYSIQRGTLTAGGDYDLTFVGASMTITKKGLTVAGAAAENKTYDGTKAATVDFSHATLPGASRAMRSRLITAARRPSSEAPTSTPVSR
jgi:hypothetical protein